MSSEGIPEPTPAEVIASGHFPLTTYLTFDSTKLNAISVKLNEFRKMVPNDVRLLGKDVTELLKLAYAGLEINPKQISLLKIVLKWPSTYIFPVLDFLRICVLRPMVNQELASGRDADRLMDTIVGHLAGDNSATNQMLAIRVLLNLFSNEAGEILISKHVRTIIAAVTEHCVKSESKNVQIALSSLFINISILLKKEQYQSPGSKAENLTGITSAILTEKFDVEAAYRLLVALGNTIFGDRDLIEMAKSEGLIKAITTLTYNRESRKNHFCGRHLLLILSPSR